MNTYSLHALLVAGCVLASGLAAAQTIVPLKPQHPLPPVAAVHAQAISAPVTAKPNARIVQPFECGPGKVEEIMNGKTTCVPRPSQPRQP
ncbi:MAG TPA: hypothetical protein VHW71_18550 [Steroidobacteraceae bacterium]|jgi:hypothetical protein|nr:hypothetical protein [Steroidobacteraceae bacterium]